MELFPRLLFEISSTSGRKTTCMKYRSKYVILNYILMYNLSQILFKDYPLMKKLTLKKKCRRGSNWLHLCMNPPDSSSARGGFLPCILTLFVFPAILIHTCHRGLAHEGSSCLLHEGSIIQLHLCSFKVTVFGKLIFSTNWLSINPRGSGANVSEIGGHFEFHFPVILWKIVRCRLLKCWFFSLRL